MLPRCLLLSLLLSLLPGAPALAARLELEGTATQGGLLVGRADPGARIVVDGRRLRISPEGVFLMGFGRDAPTRTRLEVEFPDGDRQTRLIYVRPREYTIQRIDGLPPRTVSPNPEHQARIAREAKLVRQARSLDAARTDFLDGFQWPLTGRISGVYGSQRILNGQPRTPHYGVDIAAPVGAPVLAPAPGVVTLTHPDMFYSGGTLILDHGHGLSSTFIHLDSILVTHGQRVAQGQPIARAGASGRATGPHLDWRMNLFQERLDPQLLVGPMPTP